MKLNTKSLAAVEIGIPVIAKGVYFARIVKTELKPNKSNTGNNLVIQCQLLEPTLFRNADATEFKNNGMKLTRNLSLVPTANYDPDKNLKELSVAIGNPSEKDLNMEDLLNKTCKIRVTVREKRQDPATGQEYPESNDIGGFSPIKDDETVPGV
jgi:hypothetical protein